MPTVNSSSTYEFVLFLNNYVINTLAKAINTQPYNISTSFVGLPVQINFLGPITMAVQNNAIAVNVSVDTIVGGFFQYTGKLTANLAPQFHAGGNGQFVRFRTDIISIDYEEANLKLFGYDLNLTWITNIFTWFVSKIDDYILPYIPIDQPAGFYQYVKGADVMFFNGFTQTGFTLGY